MQTSSSTAGYGIEDVYKSVISDVISNIKEIFLDESIDIDVLSQLKNEWENKVNSSGALDFDGNRSIAPPAVRQPQIKQQPMSQVYVPQQPAPGPSNFMQQQSHTAFVQPIQVRVPQQQQRPVVQQKPNPAPTKSDYGVKQLDGGGPGMSDSSSEEEEDEIDQMNRFMGLQEERAEDAEGADNDLEPEINSNDDLSDDEDLETLFQADDLIVCKFEKVSTSRKKWRFTLNDGIMHLNGKDYCFKKAVGEAIW